MYIKLIAILRIVSVSFAISVPAYAVGDMTTQEPVEVSIELGDKENKLRMYPEELNFETGKLYKLVISNPSTQKHYFTAEELARAVFTRKVQIIDSERKTLAEVKGIVNEIEVYPGGITEWWFVALKTLELSPFHCTIKGHSQAGMVGLLNVI